MKRKYCLFFLVSFILFSLLVAVPAYADSGWDSDYDSSSSSSSWESDYYSSSSSGGFSNISKRTFIVLIVVILGVVGYVIFSSQSMILELTRRKRLLNSFNYSDLSDSSINSYGYDKESLKNELFCKFVDIQNCWMNFDYDGLQKLCTNELYNTYKSQLNILKVKHGQNIMNDFNLEDIKIVGMNDNGNQITVNVYMRVSFYDYVINTQTGDVTRGRKDVKITNNYNMTFVKSKADSSKVIKCPSCNADVHVNATGRCEYCGSVIVKDANEFVLSKKTNIN